MPRQQPSRVVMQQAWVPRYRTPFFDRVRDRLMGRGIDFRLIHGHPYGPDASKGSATTLEWADVVPQRVVRIGGRYVSWQPCLRQTRGADLLICEQSAAQLVIYPLFLRAAMRQKQRFAFWGHGRNFQVGHASQSAELVKRWLSRRADWWFTYNDRSAEALREIGVPSGRITDFQNAIDTSGLVRLRQELSDDALNSLRARLGIESDHVAVYVGGMYREKRLGYLLSACDHIRRRLPDFTMLFIGDGPEAPVVKAYARERPWVHFLGPLFDDDKVPFVCLAQLQLMPGLVGLTILDSFALEVPLVTVADSEHSPEVAYLQDDVNGVLLPPGTTASQYAERVVRLLRNDVLRQQLAQGCARARRTYTLEAMIDRFVSGVEEALRTPTRSLRQYASPGESQ